MRTKEIKVIGTKTGSEWYNGGKRIAKIYFSEGLQKWYGNCVDGISFDATSYGVIVDMIASHIEDCFRPFGFFVKFIGNEFDNHYIQRWTNNEFANA